MKHGITALPAEIKVMIMSALATTVDLRSLITASHAFSCTLDVSGGSKILGLVEQREKLALLREFIHLGCTGREVRHYAFVQSCVES